MQSTRRISQLIPILIALLSAAAPLAAVESVGPLVLPESTGEAATEGKTAGPPMRLAESLALEPNLDLGPAAEGAVDRLAALAAHNAHGVQPLQNGFARPLPEAVHLRLTPEALSQGPYRRFAGGFVAESFAGGTVWGTHVRVADAYRLRLHLAAVDLPAGTRLWVWGLGEEPRAFGLELAGPNGDLWTPSVGGEDTFLEIELPAAGSDALAAVPRGFDLAEVAELFPLGADGAPVVGPAALAASATGGTKAGECVLDGTCITPTTFDAIANLRKAVAVLQFVDGSDTFVCSGGLLNDTDSTTVIPYLLTANHCFSSQAVATTLEAFWDFKTATCGGTIPSVGGLPRSSGATLLATSANSDFTFVRLNSIPAGRVLLGWSTASLANGTLLHRLSFPAPNSTVLSQAYSRGTVSTSFSGCAGLPRPRFLYSLPVAGGTFGGSSGSPVVLAGGIVVGQLLGSCGPANPEDGCDRSNTDVDGAFAATFPAISQYLQPVVTTPPAPCVPSGDTLCLDDQPGDRRFKVQVTFQTTQGGGQSGAGHAIPLAPVAVNAGGLFWFFSAGNPEMLIKVLNACSIPGGRYWVFYSAGTNVGLVTVVTDTVTGASKTYTNPDLTAAPPVQDTNAFACS